MSAFRAAKGDLWRSAEALMAYRQGKTSDLAFVGALIEADAFDCLRVVRAFLTKKGPR